MRLKDYYRTLGVPTSASADDIRKAFRKLAMQYHPDRNQESPFAEGHFRDLKEAYNILGNNTLRLRYDEERWLLGMGQHKPGAGRLTPEWIVGEGRKLHLHMQQIDTYRMNHDALQAYVLLLLSDEHLAVIKNDNELVNELLKNVLAAVARLRFELLEPVTARLHLLAGEDEVLHNVIAQALTTRKKQQKEEQTFPWIIVLIILTIVIFAFITFAENR